MYKIRILIVEDDQRIAEIVDKYLQNLGYEVVHASNGKQAEDILSYESFQLALLDVMLPDTDGWSLIKKVKKESDTPVIMLTARSEESDKLFGFELGADDYITKPFSMKLLAARIKVALKRNNPTSVKDSISIGEIEINKASKSVTVGSKEVVLTPIEYSLLMYFVDNRDIVLSRDQILNAVWGYDYFGDVRTVDTHVKRLRKKLLDQSKWIKTSRGFGYRMVSDEG